MERSTVHQIEALMRPLFRFQHLLLLRPEQEQQSAQIIARLKPIEAILRDLDQRMRVVGGSDGYHIYGTLGREAYEYLMSIIRPRLAEAERVAGLLPEPIFVGLKALMQAGREVWVIGEGADLRIRLEDGIYPLPALIALWNLNVWEEGLPWLIAPNAFLDWTTSGTPRTASDLTNYLQAQFGFECRIQDDVAWLSADVQVPLNGIEAAFHKNTMNASPGGAEAFMTWLQTLNALSCKTRALQREREAVSAAREFLGLLPADGMGVLFRRALDGE
jgi:hypothetical protein